VDEWSKVCAHARTLGFDTLMTAPLWAPDPDGNVLVTAGADHLNPALAGLGADLPDALSELAGLCAKHELNLMVDLVLDRVAAEGTQVHDHPDWYDTEGAGSAALRDPRRPPQERHAAPVRRTGGALPPGFIDRWIERLGLWTGEGVAGFRCEAPQAFSAAEWRALIDGVHAVRPDCRFLAWTPGVGPQQLRELEGAGFDAVFSSLPWWDYRSPWLVEEHARLANIAPVIAPVEAPYGKRVAAWRDDPQERRLNAIRAAWTAAATGDGLFVPMGFEDGVTAPLALSGADAPTATPDAALHAEIAAANKWLARSADAHGPLHVLLGPQSAVTALFRGDGRAFAAPGAVHDTARLAVINPDDDHPAQVDWDILRSRLPEGYSRLDCLEGDRPAGELPATLAAGALRCLGASRLEAVHVRPAETGGGSVTAALRLPRVVIEDVQPTVDGGAHPIKRVVGRPVRVRADVFMDGHDHVAAALLWRPVDEKDWRRVPMTLLNNDRWQAEFTPQRVGRHCFAVQGWSDVWTSFHEGLEKKHAAGVDVALDVAEGRQLVGHALERVRDRDPAAAQVLQGVMDILGGDSSQASKPRRGRVRKSTPAVPEPFLAPTPEQIGALLAEQTTAAMQADPERPFEYTTESYAVTVDRPAALFSSWYEIFPRSQSGDPQRHGTFDDVIAQLPRIQAMGFDTLYFPPIHPIGRRNRKGRNNSLQAGPDDPGSPYAIGAAEGGHDALHPELGTLQDFKRMLDAAREHGMEVALDFAIQCSPDHPWLAEHPEWFAWRPDGSLKYAENPPKKYEDIVNVDFYGPRSGAARQAPLWRALRDVVMFWIGHGVNVFRVDNPHTKPLPFWQWLIADVQSGHPEVIFLAEAFTKPKMMNRLAKVGFTQSYTYFTWRDTKAELTEYLTELNQAPVADFFRPHFFVNTPDINPRFLQASGRGGFLIRAALAATLSGLWGVYNGFELCEATPVPGKEEYLDSEKYEIRAWDWNRPGNIVAEVTQLNRIRQVNPALQTHLGLHFHAAYNDNVLFFSKSTPERDNVVMVAISLDPFQPQQATLEIPLWEFGLPDDGTLHAEDLLSGARHDWHGKYQSVYLHPGEPYRIWRVG
jgi:starch synthase (maltosyl-transferring)